MTEQKMKYGARKGRMSTMRRWMANASANDLRVFPVPGADLLRLYQVESEMDALLAANPREANVLLVVGELTEQLAQKAGVAYQQIPRPRVLVVAGSVQPYLPEPDVQLSLCDGFLDEALPKVRQLLKDHAWSENAEAWEPEFLKEMLEDSENGGGHDHHHGHGNGGGDNDEGEHDHDGHEHRQEEDHGEHELHDHHEGHNNHGNGGHDHNHNHDDDDEGNGHDHDQGGQKYNHSDHGWDQHGNDHDSQGDSDEDDHDHKHEDHDHSGHDHNHGDHDHGDMDFMSMVAMTKDLPRPKDGLPMNRSEAHFGPFHPGLPGGLSVLMELDGDTVIEASVEGDVAAWSLENVLPLEVKQLPDTLARLNPLTPQTYRLLAQKALADAGSGKNAFSSNEVILLENERIASHLNWLATFAKTVGNEWMHQKAARLHALHYKKEASTEKLMAFLEQIRSMPYLKTKLSVGGVIPDALLHHLSGPAAKAAGKTEDARSGNEQYQSLGWEPINLQENSAWGRLLVRLKEIEQSFELISKAKNKEADKKEPNYFDSGKGAAKLESPRGTVKLRVELEDGKVNHLELETPSKPLAALVPTLTKEAELSDALVQIASLDIAPWEIKFKGMGVNQ